MRSIAIVVCLCVAVASAASLDEARIWYEFGKFTQAFKRVYESEERIKAAFAAFRDNLAYAEEHNRKSGVTFTMGVNEFSDMPFEEFRKTRLGFVYNETARALGQAHVDSGATAGAIDWRNYGIVQGVKNQGNCGSCWAFSAVASLESANAQKYGQLPNLSEQQLVDCSGGYGNQGCNGGMPDNAFNYWLAAGGDDSEGAYPYQAVDGACRFNPSYVSGSISTYANVPQSEASLMNAVSGRVVSIAVCVTREFQGYTGGIFDSSSCPTSPASLNHAINIVGFDSGAGYWIVRNSWGAGWGEGGYIRMRMGKNLCGLADAASYPLA